MFIYSCTLLLPVSLPGQAIKKRRKGNSHLHGSILTLRSSCGRLFFTSEFLFPEFESRQKSRRIECSEKYSYIRTQLLLTANITYQNFLPYKSLFFSIKSQIQSSKLKIVDWRILRLWNHDLFSKIDDLTLDCLPSKSNDFKHIKRPC